MTRYQRAVRALAMTAAAAFILVAVLPATAPLVWNQILISRFSRESQWLYTGIFSDLESRSDGLADQPQDIRRVVAARPGNLDIQLAASSSPAELRAIVERFPRSPAAYAALLSAEINNPIAIRRADEAAFEREPYPGAKTTHADTAGYPGAGAGYPAVGSGYPGTGAGYPGAGSGYPGTGTAYPGAGSGYPGPGDLPPGVPPALARQLRDIDPPPSVAALAEFDRYAARGEALDPKNAFFPAMRAIGLFQANRDSLAQAEIMRAGRSDYWDPYIRQQQMGRLEIMRRAFGDSSAFFGELVRTGTPLGINAQLRELARMVFFKAVLAERIHRMDEAISLRHSLIRWGNLMACSRITIDSLVGIAISSIGAHEPARYLPKAHRPAQGEVYERLLRRFGHPAEAIWVANQLDFGQKRRQTISRAIQLADPVSAFTGWGRLLTFWIAGVLLLGNAICLLLVGGLSTLILKRAERIGLLPILLLPAGAAALVAYFWFLTGGSDGLLKGDSPAVLLPLAVSGLVAFLSGIVSLIRRVPLLTGITRGIAAAAVPVASLLILAYAILAPFAAAVDRKMARATLQQIQNETQYNASLVHEKWPTQPPP